MATPDQAANLLAPRNFRLSAKSVFLTYPQCPAPKEELLTFLVTLVPQPEYVMVSHEKHEDGSPHLHALLTFTKKVEKRNADVWFNFGAYHPNIQGCRSTQKCYDYVKKDGDFIEHGNSDELQWLILFDRHYELTGQ